MDQPGDLGSWQQRPSLLIVMAMPTEKSSDFPLSEFGGFTSMPATFEIEFPNTLSTDARFFIRPAGF
jgi:hypothetical protein